MPFPLFNTFVAVSTPPLDPNASGLPGTSILQSLVDGLGWWALIAAIVGVVVGAILWAFGHYSQNYQQAYNGRRGVMVSALAAVLIGGAPHIIGFFLGQGTGIA
jgi:type IV secretory pathway VirB2 component (pilin)